MRILLTILMLFLPSAVTAQKLTTTDHWLLGGSSALIKTNPILGRYPSVGRVNALIGLALVGNVLVSRLPKTPRRIIWAAVTVAEAHAVWFNRSHGLHFSTRF